MKKLDKTNNSNKLSYQKDGTPYCQRFDDIYFESESGYQQSDFVFIQKNKIGLRLQIAKQTFTVAETGFGTGLNFLLTLQAYQKAQQVSSFQLAPLHFISVEKYPLTKEQLVQSLSILPQLQSLALTFINSYPDCPVEEFGQEFKTTFFNGQVRLTLIFDDAAQGFSSLNCSKEGLVDAWYLDGFTPAKNPDMWSKDLFSQIGRLSKDQATLTTFTVAGFVKRQLRDIGFRLEKLLAKGKKKEMLSAVMQSNPITNKGYYLRPLITKPQHVSIIGGGIASACAAYALTKQGVKVTLYCKDTSLAQGGSSNAIGALYPLLHQQEDDISSFYQQAFWRAKALYTEIAEQGFSFAHQWCGLLEVSYKEALIKRQQAFESLNTWPNELIHGVNAKQASELANIDLPYGGLFMPNAGWMSPQDLVKQIFNAAKSTTRLKIMTDTHITKIQQVANPSSNENGTSWSLTSNQGEFNASVLVICGGADAIEIEQLKSLPLTATRGQVTSMKSNKKINKLSTIICHKGYLTPENNGIHCIGATFQKNDTNITTNKADDDYNLTMLTKCLPELSSTIDWQEQDISSSKARLRCMSQDHLPLVGAVPDIKEHVATYSHLAKDKNWKYSQAAPCIDNLYVLLGLGARGLCSAPLAADILTAELCNTPYPVDSQMLFNLSPNRFIIRDIIKRKVPQ
ncbi:bifunctional tRNA (5-methylaminomethyl-2-thiouridine)(34)-methyltransferase MnmD/FAD-dependent 5-carboxymethylaminomethyl-2-thiouridine(34) oxidoreductase MnmC [Colwellia sp. Bg11-28]|uniref:bifunctional tRNA (5-methylaminomethyl-2-thiouridine)(34)-methyltransferase MnmD/FAD-dependent 5-carboxymethylaminomethyl-2-thiouridine(34) oxidoreductase MnmC n=1 Tax=Colwellia sp. Bg11-28 TaxID=2058305 RepID=UPI000C341918|nr:bifunctional tRNA (5-methylaminomethyl-2-thiouridine)(34)-methyltransferase MnmD/FAD-dependent 5-carboxymethylaminomethyl-2-thiouridine(34) oxidoreductase MnmC [Colwellia sp. Bg11-28]PKH86592.1 bifunctional tRNA (5-methylaminomethyl-2-thiouridine)(34)-methyltransferase MnmD/FAD-dependent 5-carboxymethylaminomethyl-2-thiouridine(34) oxidoreductase MnmC [Colwellia sp. Bg11-28]